MATITVVNDAASCRREVQDLLSQSVIAVDLEGVNLSRTGPISLVQVATVTGHVVLFDVYSQKSPSPSMFSQGRLRELLESTQILKVMHGCNNDSDSLQHQYGVTLANVFDTQVAHMALEEDKGKLLPSRPRLADLYQLYLGDEAALSEKDVVKAKWQVEDGEYWAKRPLTEEMMNYASADVRVLVPALYNTLDQLVKERGLQSLMQRRMEEEVRRWSAAVRERLDKESKDKVLQVLRRLQDSFSPGTKFEDLDEDGQTAVGKVDQETLAQFPRLRDLKHQYFRRELAEIKEAIAKDGNNYADANQKHNFLYFVANLHPDPTIQSEAKPVFAQVENIEFHQISRKYTLTTPIHHVREQDQHMLRHIREDQRVLNGVVKRLHWMAKEKFLDDQSQLLSSDVAAFKKTFNPKSAGYYRFLTKGSGVPASLKAKATAFLSRLQGAGLVEPPKKRVYHHHFFDDYY